MKITIKGLWMAVSICLILVTIQSIEAKGLKDISSNVAQYVDLGSIPSGYKVHNATDSDDVKQITFINKETRQRMSITFSKYMVAKNKKEMSKFIEDLRKNNGTGGNGKISSEIIAFKSFYAHGQSIPYFNVNQYDNGELWTKAMIGGIENYHDKFILIQSYSAPENFNEKEMITFFSNINLKTEAF